MANQTSVKWFVRKYANPMIRPLKHKKMHYENLWQLKSAYRENAQRSLWYFKSQSFGGTSMQSGFRTVIYGTSMWYRIIRYAITVLCSRHIHNSITCSQMTELWQRNWIVISYQSIDERSVINNSFISSSFIESFIYRSLMIRLHSLPYGVANLNTSFSKNEVLGLTPSGATNYDVFCIFFWYVVLFDG